MRNIVNVCNYEFNDGSFCNRPREDDVHKMRLSGAVMQPWHFFKPRPARSIVIVGIYEKEMKKQVRIDHKLFTKHNLFLALEEVPEDAVLEFKRVNDYVLVDAIWVEAEIEWSTNEKENDEED